LSAQTGGDRYGLIGYPVSHSLSPAIFEAAFEAMGILASYDLFPLPPQRLASGLSELIQGGVRGLNVTVPHKTSVISLMNVLDESARLTGAVNTVVSVEDRQTGFNTDLGGFADSLDALGAPDVRGEKILVLGAGGAARAILASLARRGPSRILVANRNMENARNLLLSIKGFFPDLKSDALGFGPEDIQTAAEGAVLCVQATSLGLKPGDPLPAEPSLFPRACFLFDLVYGPENTPFVRKALDLGYQAVDGKEMLLRQAARTFSIWFGREAPLEAMRQAMNRKVFSRSG